MSDFSFDSNIVIDALNRVPPARDALRSADRAWISRVCWIEVMSKMTGPPLRDMEIFLDGFAIEEVDANVCERAAALRRERPRLKLPDAVILASAQAHGRILVTRNTKDFPVGMPGIRIPYTFQTSQRVPYVRHHRHRRHRPGQRAAARRAAAARISRL